MAGDDEEGRDDLTAPVVDAADLKAVAKSIAKKGKSKARPWKPELTLDFGALQWQPDLARAQPKAVLHIHLAGRLLSYVMERMKAASVAGFEVHVATSLSGLYDEKALIELAKLDATIHLIKTDGAVGAPAPLLRVLAMERIRLSPALRSQLGGIGWDLSQQQVAKQRRGRRFEAVIVFLLSQVEDFQIVETNMRTATEELDAVVQQRATQGRCWATVGAPFILVEAKNWKEPVDQPQVSVLLTKMRGKRKTVRLGLMFSASDFTTDAKDQELRFAAEDLTIAFLNGKEIHDWIASAGGDEYLEQVVQRAMLR